MRGTSQIDANLQDARGNIQFDESTWYFGTQSFGPKTPTPSYYRSAIRDLRSFNDRLEACNAVFDARADNLIQFIDRVASDFGSTSAILKDRAENYNDGWFDTRADDRFWFAYGQLYGYYGLMSATRADFEDVLKEKHLENSVGDDGAAVQGGAQDPALHYRQRARGRLDHADPFDDDGLLYPARALEPRRDQQRAVAVTGRNRDSE